MIEYEKKPGAGLPDHEAIERFKSHELAAVALEKYIEWLNFYGLRDDPGFHVMTFDEFFEWGETEVLLYHELTPARCIMVFAAGNGDEGGPALVTVHAALWDAWEIASIVQEFDSSTSIVWADGKHQFVE